MNSISQLLKKNQAHYPILQIAGELGESENIPVYIVGGYVRDILLGKNCKDSPHEEDNHTHRLQIEVSTGMPNKALRRQ